MSKEKGKHINTSPEDFFQSYAFDIGQHYWNVFGLKRASWIDIEKAKPLREARIKEILSKDSTLSEKEARKVAVKEIRPKIYGWAFYGVERDGFSEGYVLNHKNKNYSVQIIGFDGDKFILLFFNHDLTRYVRLAECEFKEFIAFIKTGIDSYLVDRDPTQLRESDLKYLIKKHLDK